MSEILQYEVLDRVATLTLNRPERRNALSAELVTALGEALRRADSDPNVGAIVLTGSGDKAFCAGADLAPPQGDGLLALHDARRGFADLLALFTTLGKPVVGAANGHALAGGFGLLMACDFVVARADAKYGTPEILRGLFPMMIAAVLLRTLGRRQTLELLLTGKDVDGATLERWGAVNRVVAADAVLPEARALAKDLASLSPAILKLGRQAVFRCEDMNFADQLEYLRSQLTLNTLAEDAAEGIGAFFEKRPPKWTGR